MMNYGLLIDRIIKVSGLERDEVERRIEAKKAKLSGLISKEGAAQIVAAELNISFDNVDAKIGELLPGMKNTNIIGKIIDLFPVREFERNGRKGKVVNLIIADDTSNIKVVLWDTKHIELIETKKIKEGDVVEIKNASVRDNEVHLSGFSEFNKSSQAIDNIKTERIAQSKNISELVEGQGIKIRGNVVQIFNPRFFHVCPECGKKVSQETDGFKCEQHGKVQGKERAILNFVIDDGTETIRAVLFSDAVNKIIHEEDLKNAEKLIAFRDDILGSEVWILGNARKNQLFGNIEIIAQDIGKVDVESLITELEKK